MLVELLRKATNLPLESRVGQSQVELAGTALLRFPLTSVAAPDCASQRQTQVVPPEEPFVLAMKAMKRPSEVMSRLRMSS